MDIVETNVFACVTNLANFSVTADSSSPIYWSILPDNGTNGAFFPNGNTGQTVTINAGPDPTTYTVTAHDQWTNCMDTATFTVQRLGLALASTNVFVNMDDDNGNGINDVNDALIGAASQVAGENNLAELTLTAENFPSPSQTVTLTVPNNIRLWTNSARGPGAPATLLNWPANAVPGSFRIEGVDASATIASSQFALTLTGGCSVNTNFTVIDVDTVAFKATAHSPLTPNLNLGGGLTLLPDRPTVTSTNLDYSQVMVEATLKPPVPGIQVHFRSIDVDDPSSGHALPLDDETVILDNKAALAADRSGKLGGGNSIISVATGANGVASTNFNTTMQPGDNFRVIASPIQEFRLHYEAVQTNLTGAVALIGDLNNVVSGDYTTQMLTVWRRLHVEVDSMEAVPVLTNTVMGSITHIYGTQAAGATQAVLNVSLVNGLNPDGNSDNLFSTPPRNGRFENGTVLIGQSPNVTATHNLLGNGPTFVRMPNGGSFDIPFSIANSNGTVTANGQIYAMTPGANDALFFVSPNLTSAAFDDGIMTVAGHAFAVKVNTSTSVRVVEPAPTIKFKLADDDDSSLLPGTADLTVLTAALAEAYVDVLNDEGGTPGNNQTDATFVLNVPKTPKAMLEASFARQAVGSDDFWVAYLLISYQYTTLEDHDPYPGGGAVGGACLCHSSNTTVESGGDGTQIFVETIRDRIANGATAGLDARVGAHEIGHQLGLFHWHNGELGVPPGQGITNNLMRKWMENVPNADARFVQQHLHLLRSRVHTPKY